MAAWQTVCALEILSSLPLSPVTYEFPPQLKVIHAASDGVGGVGWVGGAGIGTMETNSTHFTVSTAIILAISAILGPDSSTTGPPQPKPRNHPPSYNCKVQAPPSISPSPHLSFGCLSSSFPFIFSLTLQNLKDLGSKLISRICFLSPGFIIVLPSVKLGPLNNIAFTQGLGWANSSPSTRSTVGTAAGSNLISRSIVNSGLMVCKISQELKSKIKPKRADLIRSQDSFINVGLPTEVRY